MITVVLASAVLQFLISNATFKTRLKTDDVYVIPNQSPYWVYNTIFCVPTEKVSPAACPIGFYIPVIYNSPFFPSILTLTLILLYKIFQPCKSYFS